MKVLLIAPQFAKPGEIYLFPLGLAYISSVLKRANHHVVVLNLSHEESVSDAIARELHLHNPQVVLTGGISWYIHEIRDVVSQVKQLDATLPIIAGGPFISSQPELMMQAMSVDYGVLGEGEETIVDLLATLEAEAALEHVAGIIFRNGDALVKTTPRQPILELDNLPFPDYQGFELEKLLETYESVCDPYYNAIHPNPRPMSVIASRSCPFQCTFCYHPLGNLYRQRSVASIKAEVDYLIAQYGINILKIDDELFNHNEKRLEELCHYLRQTNLRWSSNFRVDTINEKSIEILKNSGVFYLFFGVESHSDNTLKSMKKHITVAQIDKTFALCAEVGLRAKGAIILGDPADTLASMQESLGWVMQHPEYRMDIRFLMAIPNAEVYQHAIARGLIHNELAHVERGFPIVNLTALSTGTFNDWRNRVKHILLFAKHKKKGAIVRKNYEASYVELTSKCPFCQQTTQSKLRYAHIALYGNIIFCSTCFAEYSLPGYGIREKEKSMLFFFHKWCYWLLSWYPAYKCIRKLLR